MNLMGYVADFEALISRYIIFIAVEAVLILIALLLVWLVPYKTAKQSEKIKHKTDRKIRLEKENKRKALIGQSVVSVLIVGAGILLLSENIDTVRNLNKDIKAESFVVYEGEAVVSDIHSRVLISDFIIDNYIVEFENSDDVCFIDVKAYEEFSDDIGNINGRITYGENSKFILKIE